MGTVDDYLAELDDETARMAIAHVYAIAAEVVPEAVQGTKYAMPALVHRGKGLISVMRTRKHLGLYPYSGRILPVLAKDLGDYDGSPGTLRFQPDALPPDDVLRRIVEMRREEIEGS
ncbi:iron chaperone [Microbacterium gorillae]|uniref:iron chaperone n=1 Tax=Microbacterium gorillae TaxID=1231063 RepID=UPI00058B8BD9|nr:hypothetical protein [Microbacterium gorillae]